MANRIEMESVLGRWESSGLSLRRFGEREGIAYAKLLYWKKKLRGGGRDQEKGQGRGTTPSSAELVPVEVVADATSVPTDSSSYSIWLGNGIGVDVPLGFDEAEVRRLVALLCSC